MLTPQKPAGQQAGGKVKVLIGIHALQASLPEIGVMTKDGEVVLDALKMLVKHFGKGEEKSSALMPAEIMQIMQKGAGPGAAPAPAAAKPPMPGAGAAPPVPAAA